MKDAPTLPSPAMRSTSLVDCPTLDKILTRQQKDLIPNPINLKTLCLL